MPARIAWGSPGRAASTPPSRVDKIRNHLGSTAPGLGCFRTSQRSRKCSCEADRPERRDFRHLSTKAAASMIPVRRLQILMRSTLFDLPPVTSKIWGRSNERFEFSTIIGQIFINRHEYSNISMCNQRFDMQKNVNFASLSAASSALFVRIDPSPLRMIQGGSSLERVVIHSMSGVLMLKRGSSS